MDTVASHARDNLLRIARELRGSGTTARWCVGTRITSAPATTTLGCQRRAAVAKVLTEGGFPADRVEATGLGRQPAAGRQRDGWVAKNRRVVIIVQIGWSMTTSADAAVAPLDLLILAVLAHSAARCATPWSRSSRHAVQSRATRQRAHRRRGISGRDRDS